MVKLMFADGHLHSNPINGIGAKSIAEKFKKVGGWFMVLVSLSPHHYGLGNGFEDYVKSIDIHIRECNYAREIRLRTICLAGLHPADVERRISIDRHKIADTIMFATKIIDYIARLVRSGLLDGFGEIGRPHYKTVPEAIVGNEILMRYTLTLAKDLNAFVHLHTEQGGYATAEDIYGTLKLMNVNTAKIVLHHLDLLTAQEAARRSLKFTLPGKYVILKEAVKRLDPVYIIESDFIDDPKRPGVSSYPWSIVEDQMKLILEQEIDEEYVHKVNIDNVIRVYDVEPP